MKSRFPSIQHWMLGRGLIADPFLPEMIKDNNPEYPDNRIEIFSKFHDRLFTACSEKLTGDKAVIMKMLHYWEYFAQSFSDTTKIIKQIKKAKTIEVYDEAVKRILDKEYASKHSLAY